MDLSIRDKILGLVLLVLVSFIALLLAVPAKKPTFEETANKLCESLNSKPAYVSGAKKVVICE